MTTRQVLIKGQRFSSLVLADVEDVADIANVKDHGAVGNGVANDTAAIQAAIDAVGQAGGGIVFLPKGTYAIGKTTPAYSYPGTGDEDRDVILDIQYDNVTLRGEGRGATILTNTIPNTTRAMILKIGRRIDGAITVDNVTVEDLSIVGNWSAPVDSDGLQSATGIDISSGCTNVLLQRLNISNCSGYGIGFERDAFSNCSVRQCLISDTGADGIDFKMDTNASGKGNLIDSVTVIRPGLDVVAIGEEQAGVNPRQGVDVSNIIVLDYGASVCGVRVDSCLDGGNTYRSMLTNIKCFCNGGASSRGLQFGDIDVSICNAYVKGAAFGYWIRGDHGKLVNAVADTCTEGFAVWSNTGETLDNNSLVNCRATGCGVGFRIYGAGTADSTALIGCVGTGNTTDVSIASATNTTLTGGEVTTLTDTGTGTKLLNVSGQIGPFTAGRNTTQNITITGDGTVNKITGVSVAGQQKAIQIAGDVNSGDVILTPGGNAGSQVRFGTHSGTADVAITGFITIKDAGGTSRKLAVIT